MPSMNPTSSVEQPDNELLSDEELDKAVRKILVDYMGLEKFEDGNALIRTIIKNSASTIVELTNSQKQAHANMVIGDSKPMPKRGDVDPDIYVEVLNRTEGANALIVEQRQRNSNHG